jgi:hypothetical protein
LGGGLFLAAIAAFVLLGSDHEPTGVGKEAAAPALAAPTPAAPSARRPIPALRPGMPLPPGHAPVPSPQD